VPKKEDGIMAKNTGHGFRRGAVRNRSQFRHNGVFFKRDATTGRILNGKADRTRHKGVRQEG
jgi:hypothetical protein